jgi:hypothetical protein
LTAGAALKLPNTLLKSPNFRYRILCRRREKRLEGAFQGCRRHPRVGIDEVASRAVVVGAVPKWHSAAAPADEPRM